MNQVVFPWHCVSLINLLTRPYTFVLVLPVYQNDAHTVSSEFQLFIYTKKK